MRRTAEEAQRTRASILHAALESFADIGWDATSFVGVGRRAGVTRGAVHHYFADKRALLHTALDEGWSDAMAPLLEALEDARLSGGARLLRFIAEYVIALAGDERFRQLAIISTLVAPQSVDLTVGLAAKEEGMSSWEDGIRSALLDADLRGGLDVDTALSAVLIAIHGFTLTAATQRSRLPADPSDAKLLASATIFGVLV
ncbi:TetR/AcrR family transcriptional regulator [Microbacterium sp. MYb62]|uniref:TetR/AcrR family transcriptional regulator n=1 Tax=Microbacterium sp. MYb62 TaxID=1848690 RepID=UPI0015E32A2F|nr:TetR/AcrR family transcriptional regulator [Microbacterium sp. MYb62]